MVRYPMQWLVEKLSERFVALFARLFASRIETMVVMQEAADRELIEQQAKQYETDGLPHLAEALRQRLKSLSADSPASLALPVIQSLAQDDYATQPDQQQVPTDEELADKKSKVNAKRLTQKGVK